MSTALTFRKYTANDLDAVVAVFRSNIPKYFSPPEESGLIEYLSSPDLDYWIGEIGGEPICVGGIAMNADGTVSLCWGMVHNHHLGTGVGRELTKFRIKRSSKRFGNAPMFTSTSQHTSGFYEKFGFRVVDHKPDGFAPGIDICSMLRD